MGGDQNTKTEKDPPGHVVQAPPALLEVPEGQPEQDTPSPLGVRPTPHGLHEAAPVEDDTSPAGQGLHTLAPAALYLPAAQAAQGWPACAAVPAAHGRHEEGGVGDVPPGQVLIV